MKVSWSGLLIFSGISKPWGRRTGGTATTGVPTGRDVSGRLGPDTEPDEGAAATATDDTATEASDKATTAAAGEEAETVAEEGAETLDAPLWARLLTLLLLITEPKVAIVKIMSCKPK